MYNSSEMHSTSEECSDNNNVCRDLCTPGTRGTLSMLVSRVHTVSVYSFITAIRHRVSPEVIRSRKCKPMAFTAESPPAQGL